MKLHGAKVLWPGGFGPGELCVQDGLISDETDGRSIDLSGFLVLPGMVDLHGDGFERHLAPRRGAVQNLGTGLVSCDAELAANGITTAVLAQFFSWEGGMRGPDFAERLSRTMIEAGGEFLTDLHLQLRLETHMLDQYDRFEVLVAASDTRFVVFNDHLPHDALSRGKRPPRITGQALKSGRSPEAHLALLDAMHSQSDRVPEAVGDLAMRLRARDVLLGSHDDSSAEIRDTWRSRGAKLAEFPETRQAAEAAHSAGDAIVLGAPNVVRGGSHKGNVSALELLRDGIGTALASDYHYPSLRQAVQKLESEGVMNLAKAWQLVSARPASVLGFEDRGRFERGLRADLVVMDPNTRRIGATVCGGRISHMVGEVAARFVC